MNIYVANINFRASEEELKDLFGQYGQVTSAKIIKDKNTGRSKGYGFVEMSDADGPRAISELNGKDFKERQLKVNEARPQEPRSGGRGEGGGNHGDFGNRF